MSNPEIPYAALTSGDPARIGQVSEAADDCSRSVDLDARNIVEVVARTELTGGQSQPAFEARGLRAYLTASMTSLRLVRVGEVLQGVSRFYADTCRAADQVIADWRNRPALPELIEVLYRWRVLSGLRDLRDDYEKTLTSAVDDYLDVSKDFRNWVRQGAILDYVFYLEHDVLPAVRIPDSYINGHGGGWVQQGLTYDPVSGQLITTSYRHGEDGDDSLLTMIDETTGEPTNEVRLVGPGGGAAPTHSGGVAVQNGQVYVVGGGKMYVYDLADLQGAEDGGAVEAVRAVDVPASSYVTVGDDGQLYVGDTKADTDEPGELHPIDASGAATGPSIATPPDTNGAYVGSDGQIVFATQTGRHARGELITSDPGGDGAPGTYDPDLDVVTSVEIANMAQNLTMVDGRLIGTTESGARTYSGPTGNGDHGTMWGKTHMFEVPNGGAGFEASYTSMADATRALRTASDGLDDELTQVRSFRLASWVVGNVSNADGFAARVNRFFEETADALADSSDAAGVTADGLAAVAQSYTDSDLASKIQFTVGMQSMLEP